MDWNIFFIFIFIITMSITIVTTLILVSNEIVPKYMIAIIPFLACVFSIFFSIKNYYMGYDEREKMNLLKMFV